MRSGRIFGVVWALLGAAGVGAFVAGWAWFEAGWVRLRVLDCPIDGLPDELVGVRIAHLSDLHLGVPSRGRVAVERAVAWVEERQPDLVCVTGDLLTRRRGEPLLRRLVGRLPHCYAVLGNHDYGNARDPAAEPSAPVTLEPATLLLDEARETGIRRRRVQIVGVDARAYSRRVAHPERLADAGADLRILLCHFPGIVDRVPPRTFHLVLAGHLHAGQICIPYGFGTLRLAHPRRRYVVGLYRPPAATLHVSPGLGTTFVPFRLFARPEVTELVLQRA